MNTFSVAKRITTAATTTLISKWAYVSSIYIACNAAGIALRVQDKGASVSPPQPVKVIVPTFTATVPTDGKPTIIEFKDKVQMAGGIDVVTTGTGEVSIWVAGSLSEETA